jgi:cell fate (sporulation/competence/biofilm development) regulator YlbF (YheA/YmcA/DUF963 family)
MSENVNLNKQVYNKEQYTKIIDTSFKELGVQTVQEQINQQPTVNDFFAMYNELFYNIPELGATNSHEYLIKTSSEYINYNANQDLINALQAEIGQLRTDLLNAQKQIVELQTGTSLANPQ